MEALKSFKELLDRFVAQGQRKKVAIVCPNDDHTEYVVRRCAQEDLVDLVLLLDGDESDEFRDFCKGFASIAIIRCEDMAAAAREGVRLVYEGKADVLMKGSLTTDVILHAVIDKEDGRGLIAPGAVMSHITLVESPVYHKLLMFSDAAVIPNPTLDQFDAMLRYDSEICRKLGVKRPKVALIHFTEKINKRYQVTTDYVELMQRAARGDYGDIAVAGPMDVKTACDAESASIKKIGSEVVGDADVLIMPDLEASNTFYKTVSYFGKAKMAGLVTGTIAPVVVASRADSAESKFYSLIFACLTSNKSRTQQS